MRRVHVNFIATRSISTAVLVSALVAGVATLTWQTLTLRRLDRDAEQTALRTYERQAELAAIDLAAQEAARRAEPKTDASTFNVGKVLTSLESVRIAGVRVRAVSIDDAERLGRVEFEVADRSLVPAVIESLMGIDAAMTWRPVVVQAAADGSQTATVILEVK